jgi:hypothetical protein
MVVAMNADASRPVNLQVNVAATLPAAMDRGRPADRRHHLLDRRRPADRGSATASIETLRPATVAGRIAGSARPRRPAGDQLLSGVPAQPSWALRLPELGQAGP